MCTTEGVVNSFNLYTDLYLIIATTIITRLIIMLGFATRLGDRDATICCTHGNDLADADGHPGRSSRRHPRPLSPRPDVVMLVPPHLLLARACNVLDGVDRLFNSITVTAPPPLSTSIRPGNCRLTVGRGHCRTSIAEHYPHPAAAPARVGTGTRTSTPPVARSRAR